jgi:hypothetical protein
MKAEMKRKRNDRRGKKRGKKWEAKINSFNFSSVLE